MFPKKHHFINIHTHRKALTANEFVIRNAYTHLTVPQIGQLPYAISVGLHPWHLSKMSIDACIKKVSEMSTQQNVLAIGEIGIDRAISTPVTIQQTYFEAQWHIAETLNKPIIIHAVRSYSDMIRYVKKSNVPFIFHQFNGNYLQAKELLNYNCKLSFGVNLFTPKAVDILKKIPIDAFFLETDTANKHTISDIYLKAAKIRGIELDALKKQLFHTFVRVFGEHKSPD